MASQKIKMAQMNLENLFISMDLWQKQDLASLTEIQWQNLSTSVTLNKSLHKLKWLAETLKEMDADIFFFCEVGGWDSANNFN
ncbi:MAG: hypothetical protein KDD22_02745, partial [Bdellovibrionales bacterium]|nr:hypothetical protein [Bdellovibrionales bacterium]